MRTVRAILNATARTQRASPKRNNDSFPRMLAAVAAASRGDDEPVRYPHLAVHRGHAFEHAEDSGHSRQKARRHAPFQETFDRHKPNESDRSGREGFHVYASDQQVERERHFTEHDRLNDAEGSIVVSWKHQRDHTEDQPTEAGDD